MIYPGLPIGNAASGDAVAGGDILLMSLLVEMEMVFSSFVIHGI